MSAILLVGVGPLPEPRQQQVVATGLRLLTMMRALDAQGHDVSLLEIPFGTGDVRKSPTDFELRRHVAVAPDVELIRAAIDEMCSREKFDAVVALTDIGALGAARSSYLGPLWVDYFGHPAAERQQQAFRHGSNAALAEYWKTVLPVLLRADRFSVCSHAQRLALIGELGAAGRMNAESCGGDIVTIIPPAVAIDREPIPRPRGFLASRGIPRDARIILSTGGMNTWFDDETFFLALERTMLNEDDIWLAVTGGTIAGHSTIVFERFRARVEASPLVNRVRFLGWLQHDEFLSACTEATVAVSCDLHSLEAELGCRNRVLGWLWLGLRVVTTALDEYTMKMEQLGFIRTFRPGDFRTCSDQIFAEFKAGQREPGEVDAIREQLSMLHSAENAAETLARWATDPQAAPDRPLNGEIHNPLADMQRASLGIKLPTPDIGLRVRVDASVELIQRLQGSRAFNLYFGGQPEVRALMEKVLKG